jgi:hypothetical protein
VTHFRWVSFYEAGKARTPLIDKSSSPRSGKASELAVRAVIEGEPVRNLEARANPGSLEYFRNLVELQS